MGLKKKLFGFVAATALTLSMVGGVAAQTPGTAELKGTQCDTGSALAPNGRDFGTWIYNGVDGYELAPDSTSNSTNIQVNVTKVPAPGKTCAVEIAITQPLTNNVEEIPNSYFSLKHDAAELSVPSTFQQSVGKEDYTLTLNNVPDEASTGTYNGTITVTVSNGS